jgi:hypothetical protein
MIREECMIKSSIREECMQPVVKRRHPAHAYRLHALRSCAAMTETADCDAADTESPQASF